MSRLIDGRLLHPPQPLELTLAALDTLPDHQELTLLVYCHPQPLFNILRNNGYVWQETVASDGTHEIRIRRAANTPEEI
jgi:uncharacterized protein (DUF2249 family)